MASWYLGINNKSVGPLTREDVLARLRSGNIPLTTLAWREGMKSWEPLSKTELAQADEPAVLPLTAGQYGGVSVAPAVQPEFGRADVACYAGFGIRAVAMAVDGVLYVTFGTMLAICFGIFLGFAMSLRGFEPERISRVANVFGFFLSLGFGIFYYGILQGVLGGSPGKLIVGLRLVRADLGPVTVWRALARYFAFLFALAPMGLGLLFLGFHPRKQGLHDLLAGTAVVTREGLAAINKLNAELPAAIGTDEAIKKAA
ncbi:MAG: RDD family protein [Deltaproteobacteria bacterium]|nr:RDD family protein [Deltaproteobacteria bacterium]